MQPTAPATPSAPRALLFPVTPRNGFSGFLSALWLAKRSESAAMGKTPMQELVGGGGWAPGREARDGEPAQETRGAEPPLPRRRPYRSVALPVFSLLLFTGLLYAAWELISLSHVVPDFILPTPLQVAQDFGLELSRGDLLANAGVFGASRLQTLLLVELPLAAPTLLSGLKLGLTLSIMGAVVGEFVAADSGLGFMISNAVGNFEVSTRYVALIALAIFSIALFGLVTLLERILLRWQDV